MYRVPDAFDSGARTFRRAGVCLFVDEVQNRAERIIPSYAFEGQMSTVIAGTRRRTRRVLPFPGRASQWRWDRIYQPERHA